MKQLKKTLNMKNLRNTLLLSMLVLTPLGSFAGPNDPTHRNVYDAIMEENTADLKFWLDKNLINTNQDYQTIIYDEDNDEGIASMTPVMIAATFGKPKSLQLFLLHKGDPTLRDNLGNNAIERATELAFGDARLDANSAALRNYTRILTLFIDAGIPKEEIIGLLEVALRHEREDMTRTEGSAQAMHQRRVAAYNTTINAIRDYEPKKISEEKEKKE